MIYLDNYSYAPVLQCVKDNIPKYLNYVGNPYVEHTCGAQQYMRIQTVRRQVAEFLGVDDASHILFAPNATYANALIAHKRVVYGNKDWLHNNLTMNMGQNLKSDLKSVFFHTMVNGTTGLVNTEEYYPNNVLMALDATSSMPSLSWNKKDIDKYDFVVFDSAKLGNIQGCCVMYIRDFSQVVPFYNGSATQERGIISGTVNILPILTLGDVLDFWKHHREIITQYTEYKTILKNYINMYLPNDIKIVKNTAPNFFSFCTRTEAHVMQRYLDMYDICVGVGSACTSDSTKPYNIVKNLNFGEEFEKGLIRLSFAPTTTKNEIYQTCEIISKVVKECGNDNRQM